MTMHSVTIANAGITHDVHVHYLDSRMNKQHLKIEIEKVLSKNLEHVEIKIDGRVIAKHYPKMHS